MSFGRKNLPVIALDMHPLLERTLTRMNDMSRSTPSVFTFDLTMRALVDHSICPLLSLDHNDSHHRIDIPPSISAPSCGPLRFSSCFSLLISQQSFAITSWVHERVATRTTPSANLKTLPFRMRLPLEPSCQPSMLIL